MGYAGDTSRWASSFPDGLVGDILDLVLSAWDSFPRPQPDDREVPITQRFCVLLRRHKMRSRLPFLIEPESQELDSATSALVGRIDLKFTHGFLESAYFSLECKRLNVIMSSSRSREHSILARSRKAAAAGEEHHCSNAKASMVQISQSASTLGRTPDRDYAVAAARPLDRDAAASARGP